MSKRTVVDQKMCDMVRLMMAGKPKLRTVADMMGIGISTVQRIQAAGYDAEEYRKNTEARKAKAPEAEATAQEETEQVPGQIEMNLKMTEDSAEGTAEYLHCKNEPVTKTEIISFMRLYAGKTEQQIQWMEEECSLLHRILEKLDKMNDNMSQILRRMDK